MRIAPTFNDAADYFRSSFRTDLRQQSPEPRWIGLENEYLLVTPDGNIVQPQVLEYLWQELLHQGWEIIYDELSHKITGVTKERTDLHDKKSFWHDVITTDLGYAILEIALAPAPSLVVAQQHLTDLIALLTSILYKQGVRLIGYGVQPLARPHPMYVGSKSRYGLMLDICREENIIEEDEYGVELHSIDAACQTQVEVSATEAIPLVNALNALSGLRVALLANSPFWQNHISDYKALRLMFVDWCWPSRKLQLGIPPKFQNIEHYIDYIFDFRSCIVKREQTLYRLDNTRAFRQFFFAEEGESGVAIDGHRRRIVGALEDIKLQCGLAWFSARLQPAYGTIEDRVSCQQPPQAHFCASALTIGLVENWRETVQLAEALSLDQWRTIHHLARQHGLHFTYETLAISALIERMLAIADQGLQMRGFGEEVYLQPLYERVKTGLCPADTIRLQYLAGGIEQVVAYSDMRQLR